jgi:hypothetical protein
MEANAASSAKLTPEEEVWVRKQPFLQSHGYKLRPRYQPGWVPSWQGLGPVRVEKFEDSYRFPVSANTSYIPSVSQLTASLL